MSLLGNILPKDLKYEIIPCSKFSNTYHALGQFIFPPEMHWLRHLCRSLIKKTLVVLTLGSGLQILNFKCTYIMHFNKSTLWEQKYVNFASRTCCLRALLSKKNCTPDKYEKWIASSKYYTHLALKFIKSDWCGAIFKCWEANPVVDQDLNANTTIGSN